jgi:hypothetical protein
MSDTECDADGQQAAEYNVIKHVSGSEDLSTEVHIILDEQRIDNNKQCSPIQ